MRAALIDDDGLVVNVIVLPDGTPPPVPLYDENGPVFEQVPAVDDDGAPVMETVPVLDDQGAPTFEEVPVLDEAGHPVTVTVVVGHDPETGEPILGEQAATEPRPVVETRQAVALIPVMVPAPPYAAPDGLEVVDLDDDSPVGPGWSRVGDGWEAPAPEPVIEDPPTTQAQLDELTDLLIEKGLI
ncbi:hypothetical protein GCM10022215_17910 [Nocardioides fonticola]|uniref:Uncharacterized protein n=1 Tax=Nocardioides fonticola TaxID=450363 RepID=A0ABP7XK84_9ACTN